MTNVNWDEVATASSRRMIFLLQALAADVISRQEAREALGISGDVPVLD